MDKRKKANQEVNDLKRKLDEKESEHEIEMMILKKKIREKDAEFDDERDEFEGKIMETNVELDSLRNKFYRQRHLVQLLKDQIECPVCLDIPRSGPLPVCPNGHFVCKECKTGICPTCRTGMGSARSLLATTVMENIDHRCKFDGCNKDFPLRKLEEHEAVCLHRIVRCLHVKCREEVSLARLKDHLLISERCCTESEDPPLMFCDDWNSVTYTIIGDVYQKDMSWPLEIYEYSGETIVVFPIKSDGYFYFAMVMLASEVECSKYTFEMIVHEGGSEALDSEMSVKFRGSPISIDVKKEELNLYGANEQLMTKIVKESVDICSISLSFKIFEKFNI